MNKFQDVFISYGRIDSKAFAKKLNSRLVEQGLEVWFDFDDIPLGVDYQNQIDDGIEKADNFLFIIAPHSINSFYCLKEIELALKRKKRIIPLLHVEQISKETWQQRLPNGNGTDEEWEAYKAQGKHSSFANMHPEIGKINWVYFRENIDDFEAAFQGLLAILERQKTYVHQHTVLLAKALEWERHQKQSQYLLIGEERQEAEQWLKVRFKEEQPPCIPTEIHCEYITESIKNANNLMTQVFLSYADEDRPTMEQIRNSLRRESITVWTNKTDIQTGEAFDEAIKRGIEQADNLVFLLSPDAVKSNYCQRELDLAVSLNKRIIPVLVSQTDPDQVPIALHSLQYINLTNNVKEDDYLLNESQLLKILHEDAAYYNEHKVLLTKALKWKRQNENPSILLRGYNLRSAETWLKVAQKRTQHRPIELQEEFITQSLQQPPLESIDIFISYSRADSDFARKLNDTLQMQGKTTWFDQESIASGSDFQQEIYRGIKACDNFLFILSPRSVNSPYCKDEVEYAASLNKRFVTVLHREVNPGDLHPELAKVQWIDFNQNEGDFNANFNQLLRSVDTDREYVHNHTKWLQRALEWQQKDKSADLLLRGNEFVIALNWLEETEKQKKKPAATELQKVFIEASQNAIAAAEEQEKHRQAEMLRLQEERTKEVEARLAEQKKSAKRQKLFLVAVSAALVAAVGVSIFALNEKREAQKNLAGQVNALSQYSNALTDSNQEFDALIEGIRAGKPLLEQRKPFTFNFRRKDVGRAENQVKEALQRAFLGVKELNRIEGQTDVTVSPDKRTIATITQDGKVRLWNFQGKEQERKPLSHNSEKIRQVYFNKDGSKIATVSGEGNKRTIQLWNSQGQYDRAFAPVEKFDYMDLSPNDQLIYTSYWESGKRTVKLWKIEGKQLQPLLPHEKFNDVSFSKDGNKIATLSGEGDKRTIKIWNGQGQLIQAFAPVEKFDYMGFSPNARLIYTSGGDKGTVKLWKIEGKQLQPLLPNERFNYVRFSKEGNKIATVSGEGNKRTIKLWNGQGQLIREFAPVEKFDYMGFSPNAQLIYTVSWGGKGTVKLWKIEGKELQPLLPDKEFNDVNFSDDNKLIATTSNKMIKLWTQDGEELQTLYPGTVVNRVYFDSKGKTIATVSSNKTVSFWNIDSSDRKLLEGQNAKFINNGEFIATIHDAIGENQRVKIWNWEGKPLDSLPFDHQFNNIYVSDDGKLIAIYSGEGDKQTVKLWSVEGRQLQPLLSNETFNNVGFSKDGKLIATDSGEGEKQTVKLWSVEGRQLQPLLSNETFNGVRFSNDGKLIATVSGEGEKRTVKLWNSQGQPIQSFDPMEKFDYIYFSPNDQLFVTNTKEGDNNTAKLWKIEDKKLKPLLPDEKFNNVSFSNDGNLIATTSGERDNRTVKLWSLEGKQLQYFLSNETFNKVSFSDDGKLIATFSKGLDNQKVNGGSSDNQTVKLWTRDGKKLDSFPPNEKIDELKFSPDGKLIATLNTSNYTVKFWKLAENQPKPLPNLDQYSFKVNFSPDSKLIATFNNNRVIQVWNRDGKELARLKFNESIQEMSFSPNSKILAISSKNKALILWNLKQEDWEASDLKKLVEKACEKVGNYLRNKPETESDKHLCDGIGTQK